MARLWLSNDFKCFLMSNFNSAEQEYIFNRTAIIKQQ